MNFEINPNGCLYVGIGHDRSDSAPLDITDNLTELFDIRSGKTDDGWACDVTDASKMQGFKGDDVKLIKFIEGKDGSLILKTELCMSREGDVFKTNLIISV